MPTIRRSLALLAGLSALLLLAAPAAAQGQTTLIDQTNGAYRVVATLQPFPLSVGTADIVIAITDSATGAPRAVSAVNVITSSAEVGMDHLYISPPVDDNRANSVYKTDRLYFATSGQWNIRLQIITSEGQFELPATVEVGSVYARIGEAALITVPATLGALLLVALAWRFWRRRMAKDRA
jgi:hypothetical protein